MRRATIGLEAILSLTGGVGLHYAFEAIVVASARVRE